MASPRYLHGVFPADGIDWTKFSAGSLSRHMTDMSAFAHAWAPLERRWEAGGAPAFIHASAWSNMLWLGFGWIPDG
jgi:hypothetical protein